MVTPIQHITSFVVNPDEHGKQHQYKSMVPYTTAHESFEETLFDSMLSQFCISPASTIEMQSGRLNFSLQFQSKRDEKISVYGFCNQHEETFFANILYSFQRIVLVNGSPQLKNYILSAKLNAHIFQEASVAPQKEKEDIISFLYRLVNDVFRITNDDSKMLEGINFQQEDLNELIGLDDSKVTRMCTALFDIVLGFAFAKKIKINNETEESVTLPLEEETMDEVRQEQKISFSLVIDEAS